MISDLPRDAASEELTSSRPRGLFPAGASTLGLGGRGLGGLGPGSAGGGFRSRGGGIRGRGGCSGRRSRGVAEPGPAGVNCGGERAVRRGFFRVAAAEQGQRQGQARERGPSLRKTSPNHSFNGTRWPVVVRWMQYPDRFIPGLCVYETQHSRRIGPPRLRLQAENIATKSRAATKNSLNSRPPPIPPERPSMGLGIPNNAT